MYYKGEEYKEAHKWKARTNMLKTNIKVSTRLGVQTFGRELGRTFAGLVYIVMRIVSKICTLGIIIFGISTVSNLMKMGFCVDIIHTKSFLLFAVSFFIGIVSFIIMIAAE